MDLFVNQQNFNNLNSYFLKLYARRLFHDFFKAVESDNKLSVNLRPDFSANFFPPFKLLIVKFLDFIKFSHTLKRRGNIWFRVKFADVPYCVFSPASVIEIEYLMENGENQHKVKLNCCHSCKYKNICGGIHKSYLQKYGEKEFHSIPDLPWQIMLEVESRCNLSCRHCFNRNSFAQTNRNNPSLKTSEIKEIIKEISRLKIPTVRFTGGEPMLRPDIYDLLKCAKDKGLRVTLNSNGILIDETAAKKLDGLIDNILISIQGVGREGDNAVGKTGATQGKIEAIFNLKKFVKTEIFIATVLRQEIMEKNGIELDKIHSLIKKIGGVSRWHLCRCIPENKESYRENVQNYKKLVDKLLDWQLGKEKFRLYYYPYVISNGIPFCFYDMDRVDLISYGGIHNDGYGRMSIDPTGIIRPIYYSQLNLSDNPRDILGAWNHPFLKKLRNFEFLPPACQNCFYKRKCLGGGRFWANFINGNYSAPDPLMPDRDYESLS